MGKRVLVADDSATIQRAFAMVFGNREDVSLVPARSLDEAVTSAKQGRPDLVIADANLAGRTGYELCSAIKSDAGLRGVPVYILASSHSPYDDGKGRSAGVDGHLTKPFESQALIDKVLEILARPTSIAATVNVPRAEPLAPTPQMARPAANPSLSSPSAFSASAARPSPFGASVSPSARAQVDDDDDDYGEIKIERAPVTGRTPPGPRPAASPPVSSPPAASARPPAGVGAAPTSFATGATPSGPLGASPTSFATSAPTPAAGLRPSLIPGARPGGNTGRLPYSPLTSQPPVASAARPAAIPSSPSPPAQFPSSPAPSAPAPVSAHGSSAPAGRTIMGLPAVAIPGVPVRPTSTPPGQPAPSPGLPGIRSPSTGPVPLQPVPPREVPTGEIRPAPSGPLSPPASGPVPVAAPSAAVPSISVRPPSVQPSAGIEQAQRAIDQKLDQKLAAISAKGPEYEAIAKLSREIIEQVVWEVVPELAEVIIREHVERLAQTRK